MNTGKYDVAVIGGGTGGYSAAIRASELGLKVAIVEKDLLGGTCLHRGCIPTKAWLYAAELADAAALAATFGISLGKPNIDWLAVQSAKSESVKRLADGLAGLLGRRGVDVVRGEGRLVGRGRIAVKIPEGGEREIESESVIIATGSSPKSLPGVEIDGKRVFTSDEIFSIERLPSTMAIIGGGYIGCEFASAFNSFGTKVTIIEALPELLAAEDAEIKERIAPAFKKRGISLRLGASVKSVKPSAEGVSIEMADGPPVESEVLFIAIGRRPVTEGIGLEAIGAKTDGAGYVSISEDYSAAPGAYAIGDCIDTLALAHASFAEGYFVAERIAGENPAPPNYDAIPRVVYSFPEVASVGISEEEAARRGLEVETGRFPFRANSRAVTMKSGEGFAKIVAMKGGDPIIGVHLVGPHVSELVSEGMLAVAWEASAADLAALHHPHPTLSETLGEAAMKLAGMPLHSL